MARYIAYALLAFTLLAKASYGLTIEEIFQGEKVYLNLGDPCGQWPLGKVLLCPSGTQCHLPPYLRYRLQNEPDFDLSTAERSAARRCIAYSKKVGDVCNGETILCTGTMECVRTEGQQMGVCRAGHPIDEIK
jgi:hypothetical protein